MTTRGFALLLCLLLVGCTRVIDTARPQPEPVAPIAAGQVSDLLSARAKPEDHPNLFATVEPDECAGLAREVDPPFIFATTPAAHDGGQSFAEDDPTVSVQEIVGVYRANFDPKAKLDEAKRTIANCQHEALVATAMQGQVLQIRPVPSKDSGSPEIVLWALTGSWSCDSAFIAAYNAAVEITACSEFGGYDVLPLARDAAKRIETLANATA